MKIEICENTGGTIIGCCLLFILCALGINGCNKTAATEQAAIKAGLEQKDNFGEIRLTFGTNTFTIKAAASDQVTFAKEVVGAAVREGIQAAK